MNVQRLPVTFELFLFFLWKKLAHCAVVYITLHTGT